MTDQLIKTALDVPFAMTSGTRVPAPRYFDRYFAQLEDERLWSRTWQMACRLEEIPAPGDYVTYTIGDQSLIVLRLDEDTVRAHHNACRHRGTQLAVGSGSFRGGQIACPFHGWRYNLDGTSSFFFGDAASTESVTDPLELCL